MDRERIANLPFVVTALCVVTLAVRLGLEFAPEPWPDYGLFYTALISARIAALFAPGAVSAALGGVEPDLPALLLESAAFSPPTLLTYVFIHANWPETLMDILLLAALGGPVARRLGALRFLGFFVAVTLCGALALLVSQPFSPQPMIGAAAAVSGMIAAIARFAFMQGERLGEPLEKPSAAHQFAASLSTMLSNRRATTFLIVWLVVFLVFGFVALSDGGGIAFTVWKARIGGFIGGLLLFGLFDRKACAPVELKS